MAAVEFSLDNAESSLNNSAWQIKGESPGMIPKPLMYYTNHAVIYHMVVNLSDLWLEAWFV